MISIKLGQVVQFAALALVFALFGRWQSSMFFLFLFLLKYSKCHNLFVFLFFFSQDIEGNTNEDKVSVKTFLTPFIAKFVRIRPVTWHQTICLRIELYGCEGKVLNK